MVERRAKQLRRLPSAVRYVVVVAGADLRRRLRPPARVLGRPAPADSTGPGVTDGQRAQARLVGRRVDAAAKRVPWSVPCLSRAIAARDVLRREGIPAQIVLGCRPGDSPEAAHDPAHAWLRVGDRVVVGAPGHREFVPVAVMVER